MCSRYVLSLTRISDNVVQFFPFDESPSFRHRGTDFPEIAGLGESVSAVHLRVQNSFRPFGVVVIHQAEKGTPIKIRPGIGAFQLAKVHKSWRDIQVSRQSVNVSRGSQLSAGPSDEKWDTMATIIGGTLAAPHVCVFSRILGPSVDSSAIAIPADGRPIVGHVDHDCVIAELFLFKEIQQSAHVPIEV